MLADRAHKNDQIRKSRALLVRGNGASRRAKGWAGEIGPAVRNHPGHPHEEEREEIKKDSAAMLALLRNESRA